MNFPHILKKKEVENIRYQETNEVIGEIILTANTPTILEGFNYNPAVKFNISNYNHPNIGLIQIYRTCQARDGDVIAIDNAVYIPQQILTIDQPTAPTSTSVAVNNVNAQGQPAGTGSGTGTGVTDLTNLTITVPPVVILPQAMLSIKTGQSEDGTWGIQFFSNVNATINYLEVFEDFHQKTLKEAPLNILPNIPNFGEEPVIPDPPDDDDLIGGGSFSLGGGFEWLN